MQTIINEASSGGKTPLNTGKKSQKSEGAVKTYFLARADFSFADEVALKSKSNWDTAKANKDIIPMYQVEAIEDNNTEDTIANKRFKDSKTKNGLRGVTYSHELSEEQDKALRSYDESDEYTRIFGVTTENEILCEIQEDGTIKGQPRTSFIVGVRTNSVDSTEPVTKVMIKFDDYAMSNIKPDFKADDIEGIYDVKLVLVSATATSIKFKALTYGGNIPNLTVANLVVKNVALETQTIGLNPLDSNTQTYEVTGTGFANDFTLDIDAVQKIGDVSYESENALVLTGI